MQVLIRLQITNTCLLIVHVFALIQYYVYEEFNHSVLREVVVRGLVFVVFLGCLLEFEGFLKVREGF